MFTTVPKTLLDAASSVLDESTLLREGTFMRLPTTVINNELFVTARSLKRVFDNFSYGSDFDPKEFDKIIKTLQEIRKKAKSFNSEDEVPKEYMYPQK